MSKVKGNELVKLEQAIFEVNEIKISIFHSPFLCENTCNIYHPPFLPQLICICIHLGALLQAAAAAIWNFHPSLLFIHAVFYLFFIVWLGQLVNRISHPTIKLLLHINAAFQRKTAFDHIISLARTSATTIKTNKTETTDTPVASGSGSMPHLLYREEEQESSLYTV